MLAGLPTAAASSSVIAQPMSSWQRTRVTQPAPAGTGGIDCSVRVISATLRVASELHSSTMRTLW